MLLIQVLKQIKWFGLLYFVANNIVYQLLFKKYRKERRRVRSRQEAPQNQPEVERKNYKLNLLFALLIGSWFMHNAVSLYLLNFEVCGRAIYERFFKDHVEYIRSNNHPIQTEFIKALFCEQSQIALALILLVCLFQKNYLWKALAFLVAFHFVFTYHQVKEMRTVVVEDSTIKRDESNNIDSSYENGGEYYYPSRRTDDILLDSVKSVRYEKTQETLAPEIEKGENGHIEEEEVVGNSGFYEPVDETKKIEKDSDCFKTLSWMAYIPLKAISLGLEVTLEAGEAFEYVVCKCIG